MLEHLRRAVRVPGFAAVTATLLPAYLVVDSVTPPTAKDETRDRWVKRWSRALLRLFAVKVDVVRMPPPPKGRGRLVVMNHRSAIDTGIALATFGGRMVSRGDLAKWPVLGVAARKVGTVFVDRQAASSGAATMRTIRDHLKAGQTVTIFAEGTTFGDDEVRPFHAGSFVAALHTGAEIVPAGLAYATGSDAAFLNETFMAHLHRMAGGTGARVVLALGEPFVVEAEARSGELRDRTHAAVQALVHEARKKVDG